MGVRHKAIDSNLQFIYDTQPQGGVSFKEDFYNRFGDGYQTCIHVIQTQTLMSEFWLMDITSLDNVIVTVDSHTDENTPYRKSLSESIEELESRKKKAPITEIDNLEDEIMILRELSLNE
ncbi:hypothetical protein [Tetragenococcus koreensis]|uniref:hypothetical protein n=1 Tax=Tetragenococcus koreensis TaxID=290335 RepID=UPI001F33C24A|nr:hypothetical protein [Tetragenococcus koreensis]MDN6277989.1 hypothetical protein [Lactococcus lactis]MCF1618104.1 hypothetical protein [Tetragenococcus koreensis]MCF1627803.1 hypothetical protein [Tetragenococcus koreensis]MCF1678946.1 hypothetical protein [Tetragenococcus koreensis]MCF1681375.1 hypothetical protein [Tetragenococcus koreensis]